MNVQDSIQQLWAVNPANVLLIGGLGFFVAGCLKKSIQGESQRVIGAIACLMILAVSAVSAMNMQPLQATSNALFVADSIAFYGIKLTLFCGVLLTLLGRDQAPLGRLTDYYGCFLLLLSGLIYLSAATDLIALFLSMELISIPTVVLLSITQGKTSGMEATFKVLCTRFVCLCDLSIRRFLPLWDHGYNVDRGSGWKDWRTAYKYGSNGDRAIAVRLVFSCYCGAIPFLCTRRL